MQQIRIDRAPKLRIISSQYPRDPPKLSSLAFSSLILLRKRRIDSYLDADNDPEGSVTAPAGLLQVEVPEPGRIRSDSYNPDRARPADYEKASRVKPDPKTLAS